MAKDKATHRRRESGQQKVGVDGVDIDNFTANEDKWEDATVVATDGVHLWNKNNTDFTARTDLDLNNGLAPALDARLEFESPFKPGVGTGRGRGQSNDPPLYEVAIELAQ